MKTIFKFLTTIGIFLIIAIVVLQCIFLLVGPDYKEGTYTMVYKVYYPNNPRTYTITNDWPIDTYSSRGTNYVVKTKKTPWFKKMFRSESVFRSSAPIEVVSYTYKEK